MFRFAVAVLAAFGLGALIFGGIDTAAAGFGLLVLAPIFFIFKMFLFLALFGMISRAMWRRDSGHNRPFIRSDWHNHYRRHRSGSTGESRPDRVSEGDRLDEWHRMSHAKDEVESWTNDEV